MTTFHLMLTVIGVATVTGWIFKLIDWIERPLKKF